MWHLSCDGHTDGFRITRCEIIGERSHQYVHINLSCLFTGGGGGGRYLGSRFSTSSGGQRNAYGWQAGGSHPTGILSCWLNVCNSEVWVIYGWGQVLLLYFVQNLLVPKFRGISWKYLFGRIKSFHAMNWPVGAAIYPLCIGFTIGFYCVPLVLHCECALMHKWWGIFNYIHFQDTNVSIVASYGARFGLYILALHILVWS